MTSERKIRTLVISGAGAGIGAGVAELFAERGANIVIIDRDAEAIARTSERIRGFGVKCLGLTADLNDIASTKFVADRTMSEMGDIDCLVNCAGNKSGSRIEDATEQAFDGSFDLNVKSLFFMIQAFLPSLRRAAPSSIVNISSVGATLGQPGMSVYGATKGAVDALTRGLAVELGPYNIRVNAVRPGSILTETNAHKLSGRAGGNLERGIELASKFYPIGKIGVPKDIAKAVHFLSGDEASFITGVCLDVDGGFSIQFPFSSEPAREFFARHQVGDTK